MSETKYLLAAIPHEMDNHLYFKEMQQRIQKVIPNFYCKCSIGPHITLCPPFTVKPSWLELIKQDLSRTLSEMEPFPITLASWNFFTDKKNKIQTIYRVIDTQEYVHQQLRELNEIPYGHGARLVGQTHRFHLHQTLGTILCTTDEFKKMKNSVTWAVMEGFSPLELCLDRFILYTKHSDEKEWKELYVFKM